MSGSYTGSFTVTGGLNVSGSNHFVTFENTSTTANHYAQILLKAGDRQNYIWTANQNSTSWGGAGSLNIYTNDSGSSIAFFTQGDATNTKLMIRADGNIGIGTNSPEHKLVVTGTIGFGLNYNGGVYANNTVTGVDENWGLEVQRTANVDDYNTRLKYYPVSGQSRAAGIYDSRNTRFSLYSDTNNNPNIIIPNGNVGIGTTNPETQLSIGDYTDSSETITIATSDNGTGRINFYDNNNTEGGSIRVVGETGGSKMYFANRWNTDSDKVVFDLKNGTVAVNTPATFFSVQTGTSTVTIPNSRYLNFYSGEILFANFSRSFICSISDDTATTQPKQIGLIMHNNSKVNNTFSPGIVFGSQANSSSYSDSTAMIAGRRNGQSGDANWSSGQLWFWTATEGAPVSGAADRGLPDGYPAMVINEYRRVMIGTNTASTAGQPNINQALQVATGYSNDGIVIHGNGSNDGMTGGGFRKIGFRYDESDESFESEIRFVVTNASAHGGQLEFWTDNSSGTKTMAMTIDKSQYVGIGVNTPVTRLDIEPSTGNSSIKTGGLEMQSYSINNGWYAENLYYDGVWRLRSAGFATQMYMEAGTISFKRVASGSAGASVSPETTMRLHSSGNIGINMTATPTRKLQIEGGSTYPLSVNSTQRYLMEFARSGTSEWWIAVDNGSFILHENGVGDKITVASGGTLTAAGDLVAYSDERLKSNIKTLDGSKVLKMRGVSFEKEGKKGSGVIAQELEKVAPELVNNDNEYKGVAYGNLTGYLIEAIKEQQKQIEDLQAQIKNISNTN
jgi:uncharacterized protein YaiE (UPF0345 family)